MNTDSHDDAGSCDVAIVGAGLIGGSLALALADSGLRLALIEASPRFEHDGSFEPDGAARQDWDSRIYAISPGSAAFLEQSGIWSNLDPARLQPVSAMQIRGDDAGAQLDFNALQSGLPELAFIAESREIERAISLRIAAQANLRVLRPAICASVHWQADAAEIQMQDGAALKAKLVVGADGADSWVRAQAGITVETRDYAQRGVVANFATAKPHGGIARQWFREDGVLALLPLPGQRVSLVWSTGNDNANRLLESSEDEFGHAVEQASQSVLGKLDVLSPPRAFPLRLQRVGQLVKPRVALIGDAAHNLHPLAGQGVNLGFQDARELAAVLRNRGAQTDCGDYFLLRAYERARKEAILAMQLTTDGLQKLFSKEGKALSRLRNAGLSATNRLNPLKKRLVQHALG
ncbi:MAG: UbiH/UbiF family hydroxylase [Burkholderiales bacterium]|nr:UbiH/UbiF family hydroxylase [Burkholderiales bacterium]MDQ3196784.1 UbiH/UbiF family hydroxylase [Pseudomonadota bacterium]